MKVEAIGTYPVSYNYVNRLNEFSEETRQLRANYSKSNIESLINVDWNKPSRTNLDDLSKIAWDNNFIRSLPRGRWQPRPKWGLWDIDNDKMYSFMKIKAKLEEILQQFLNTNVKIDSSRRATETKDYQKYLQYPSNKILTRLANQIVRPFDSNDEKMYKIEEWVKRNIKYTSDITTYGQGEYWAYPTETLQKKKGDCEDGAFLIGSLALYAGIPSDKLRVYGGLVISNPVTLETGGHAWCAYQRESDDKWVNTDWCYYATDEKMSERQTMAEDERYIDDYFYITATQTVETPIANKIRFPSNMSTIDAYMISKKFLNPIDYNNTRGSSNELHPSLLGSYFVGNRIPNKSVGGAYQLPVETGSMFKAFA